MNEGKDLWHDVRVGITKELIVQAVIGTCSLPIVLAISAVVWQSLAEWLLGDSHTSRWAIAMLA